MCIYNLNVPTKIYYGRNILERSIREAEIISGNLLVVSTGGSIIKHGYLSELAALLEALPGVQSVEVYCNISSNPDVSEINGCVEKYRDRPIDSVIGFGGGSSIDAAKVTAACIGMKTTADLLFGGMAPDERTLPVIAIPTTAGTGSELSRAAIISDRSTKKKDGIRGQFLYPRLAIVDSMYTETVPYKTTMETGFDVMAHAIESYVSRAASPYTKLLSREAMRIAGENLMLLKNDMGNIEARKQMSFASMIMGINLGNASTALPHRLQYPLGAHTLTSHGAGLAALYPAWAFFEYENNPLVLSEIYEIIWGIVPESPGQAFEMMGEFVKSLDMAPDLPGLGVCEKLVPVMADEITGNIKNDPAADAKDIIEKIYKKAFGQD